LARISHNIIAQSRRIPPMTAKPHLWIVPRPGDFRLCVTLTTIALWFVGLTIASAGLDPPLASATLSADRQRLLVMMPTNVAYERLHPTPFVLPDGRSVILHETFAKSGAYDARTLAPIWQVDWYSNRDDVFRSADFTDVARVNPYGLDSDWAVAFYHEGRLTRRYACAELITALRSKIFFPFKSWGWHIAWSEYYELNGNQLAVSTARRRLIFFGHEWNLGFQEFYTFDLHTGAITSRSTVHSPRPWMDIVRLAFIGVAAMIGVWLWRLRRRDR
jgi:hypothetical protein